MIFSNVPSRNDSIGVISAIQQFSVGDGPGIRTTVFMKGCNLRCKWCHNPETQDMGNTLMFYEGRCSKCRRCVSVCPNGATFFDGEKKIIDRNKCMACGNCVSSCENGALELIGKRVTVSEVMQTVMEDVDYYKSSGGGVTVSGGEPLLQKEFCTELARACKKAGINVIIDTAATLPVSYFDSLIPFVDEFYVDVKGDSDEICLENTGGDLSTVLRSIKYLIEKGCNVTVRLPIIPNIGDVDGYGERIEALLTSTGIKRVHLLPYHGLCSSKYKAMGLNFPYEGAKTPESTVIEKLKNAFSGLITAEIKG